MKTDLPVDAEVQCTNGACGRCTYIVLDPAAEQVTHLAVKEKQPPHVERLVPIDEVVDSNLDVIRLRCSQQELAQMEAFADTEYVQVDLPDDQGPRLQMWPTIIPKSMMVRAEVRHIPPGEVAIGPGVRVQATDGHVGYVDELMVDPTNEHITHLVLREGHLWAKREIVVPVSHIDRIEEDIVYLHLDKHSIETLPSISSTSLAA
jgi:sporulation protein YlmC with PRC-barrel domain